MDRREHSALEKATPARIAVGRVGSRPRVAAWIRFRHDHAVAKDAVKSELSEAFLNRFAYANSFPVIQTDAFSREDFILNPPRGKTTSSSNLELLRSRCLTGQDVQIVICDGLSALAVESNVMELLPMLEDGLRIEGITVGTPVVVRFGRVAIADQINHTLGARLAINLIGERPGLSSGLGMSAYLTLNAGPKTISSDRTVVSNIHSGGTPPVEAGAYIVHLAKIILEKQVSGVQLQKIL